jgi:hypothetical protein
VQAASTGDPAGLAKTGGGQAFTVLLDAAIVVLIAGAALGIRHFRARHRP